MKKKIVKMEHKACDEERKKGVRKFKDILDQINKDLKGFIDKGAKIDIRVFFGRQEVEKDGMISAQPNGTQTILIMLNGGAYADTLKRGLIKPITLNEEYDK